MPNGVRYKIARKPLQFHLQETWNRRCGSHQLFPCTHNTEYQRFQTANTWITWNLWMTKPYLRATVALQWNGVMPEADAEILRNIFKEDDMGGVCSTHRKDGKCIYNVTCRGDRRSLDSWLDLVTTHRHDSYVQVITAPPLISTAPVKPSSSLLWLHGPFPGNGF
jgi:hypothetical protein